MTSDLDKYRTPEGPIVRSEVAGGAHRPALSAGFAKYLQAALSRLDHLEYGDPSEYILRRTGVETSPCALGEVWVPPIFKVQEERGPEVNLDSVLADVNSCILILAQPGHGKSTLARFLTCYYLRAFQEGTSDSFGLYVPLSELRIFEQPDQRAIVECALKYVGLAHDTSVLHDIEQELDNAVLIFDGLDELPVRTSHASGKETATLRRNAAEIIRLSNATRTTRPGATHSVRSIVTCRTNDYYEDPESSLGAVTHYILSGFASHQIPQAIRKWHDAAKAASANRVGIPANFSSELDDRVYSVQAVLRENSDLGEVCLTPLMLSILQSVYSDRGDLPASVSQLCNRAVNWLLVDKHTKLELEFQDKRHREWVGQVISQVGWEIHKRVVDGRPKGITDDDLRLIAKATYPFRAKKNSELEARDLAISQITSHLRRGHGILVNVSEDQYDFAHNVFREVMAGRALGMEPLVNRRQYALLDAWHGPIRYWAGLRAVSRSSLFEEDVGNTDSETGLHEISAFVGELEGDCVSGNAIAILACGEMLAEACAIRDPTKFSRDLKSRIATTRAQLVDVLGTPQLRFMQRVRAGDILGSLGDPRLEVPALNRMCHLAAGGVTIGRASNHATRNVKYERSPAAPPISGFLAEYSIASFLTTNSEFAAFISAGGYRSEEFWPSEYGWKWANGDSHVVAELIDRARASAPTHLSTELQGRRIVKEDIPDRCEKMIARDQPMYWDDPALNRSNQPVVGINWWEAQAYCKWLEAELRNSKELAKGHHIRLPIEAEWEAAARRCGNDNIYPWKSGLPENNAHLRAIERDTKEGYILRSCAIGSFSFVPTNISSFDLVGNVWEWTGSKLKLYAQNSFLQTVDNDGLEERIARGSSWLSQEIEASQVTFRSFDPPYNAYEDLGFRIALGGAI